MFDNTGQVALRFDKIEHLTMTKEEKEIGLVKVTLELNPLTTKRAEDLSEFIRRTLYTRTDAEVVPQLQSATFNLSPPPQEIVVRMAPDQPDASFTIREAKVGDLIARRSKKSSSWRLRFAVTFAPASEHELAQVVDCYTKTRYLVFADAQPDLFSESTKQRTKAVRAERAQGIGPAAATH